ncbi:MAG: serine hydrolase domain-containing protein [Bacteroidota bacterium]
MRYLILCGVLFLTISMRAQNAQELLDEVVDSFRIAYQVPGVAVAIVRPNRMMTTYSGVRNANSREFLTASCAFHLASNTKAITALVCAYYVEQELIQWDTPLSEVLPSLADSIHPHYREKTLQDFLSHRTGIAPFEDDRSEEWKGIPNGLASLESPARPFAHYALQLPPQELSENGILYSNGNYAVAALMLESAIGKSWEEMVRGFLELVDVYPTFAYPAQKAPQQTHGHRPKTGGKIRSNPYRVVQPNEADQLPAYLWPAGNLSCTLDELAKLTQLQLTGLGGVDNLLTAASYSKIHYGFDHYSLGWYNGHIGSSEQRFSYHGGSLGSFSSAILLSPDRQVAVLLLVNADGKRVTEMKDELRKRLWSLYSQP